MSRSAKSFLVGILAVIVIVGGFAAYRWWPRQYGKFDLTSIKMVDTSAQHSLLLLNDGTLWGVGDGQVKQLAVPASSRLLQKKNSYTGDKYTVKPIKIMDGVTQAEAGFNFSLVLKSDSSLWGFGYNRYYELSIDTQATTEHPGTDSVKIMDGVSQIASGSRHSMAVKSDGSLWGIGVNQYGQLGVNNPAFEGFLEPPKVMDDVKAVFCGSANSFVIKNDGSLWSMGRNVAGELGYAPESEINYVPRRIADNVTMVAAYEDHTLLLTTEGRVMGMGSNSLGQLGLEQAQVSVPTPIANDAKSIAVGRAHSLILKNDGTLWGLGDTSRGQLGITGTNIAQLTRLQENVKAVYAAADHTLVLTNSGELLAWGANDHGQIGLPGFFLAGK